MKKVLFINGGMRTGGNEDAIMKAAMEAAKAKGAEVIDFKLRETNLLPCTGCGRCKSEKMAYKCKWHDGFSGILPTLLEADGIVFSSPIYYGYISGPAKTFVDRLYCLMNPAKGPLDTKKKKFGVVLTFGGTPEEAAQELAEKVKGYFRMTGADELKTVLKGKCTDKKTASKDEATMAKAKELGEWLAE